MKPRVVTVEIELETDMVSARLREGIEGMIDHGWLRNNYLYNGGVFKRTQRVRIDVRKARKTKAR